MKKAQLHELLAVEQDLRSTKDREKDATIHTFTQRPDVFKGAIKTLIMFDENRKSEEGEGHEEERRHVPASVPISVPGTTRRDALPHAVSGRTPRRDLPGLPRRSRSRP